MLVTFRSRISWAASLTPSWVRSAGRSTAVAQPPKANKSTHMRAIERMIIGFPPPLEADRIAPR